MSLSKSKCWYSNNCVHFSKRAVPLASVLSENNHKHYHNLKSVNPRSIKTVFAINYCVFSYVLKGLFTFSKLGHWFHLLAKIFTNWFVKPFLLVFLV
jgi:hypothetical protein